MDEPGAFDEDIEHVIRSYGIAGFEYRGFDKAVDRLPKSTTPNIAMARSGQMQRNDANEILLAEMYKKLSSMD